MVGLWFATSHGFCKWWITMGEITSEVCENHLILQILADGHIFWMILDGFSCRVSIPVLYWLVVVIVLEAMKKSQSDAKKLAQAEAETQHLG